MRVIRNNETMEFDAVYVNYVFVHEDTTYMKIKQIITNVKLNAVSLEEGKCCFFELDAQVTPYPNATVTLEDKE